MAKNLLISNVFFESRILKKKKKEKISTIINIHDYFIDYLPGDLRLEKMHGSSRSGISK